VAARYGFRSTTYPLFRLSARKGGYLRTVQVARQLRLGKVIRHGGLSFYFLSMPGWPSQAYDGMAAHGGLNVAAAGTPLRQHVDMVILAITGRCSLACRHCYEQVNIGAADAVPLAAWQTVVDRLQEMSTGVIVLSGGEPMLAYDETLALVRGADKHRSDIHVHTSGRGVTLERARELRAAGLMAAGIGLDDGDAARHNRLRGSPSSFDEAVSALRAFRDAGVLTYTNTCVTPAFVHGGGFWELLALARDLGVGAVRLLEPKPCGGYAGEEPGALFSDADRAALTGMFIEANTRWKHRRLPLVAYEAYFESPERRGCSMGGLSFFAVDSRGNVLPCVFLPVSFGNILEEDIRSIYGRMRAAVPRPLHRECPAVALAPFIGDRVAAGAGLPVPVGRLDGEWRAMWGEG
jgi:MoaA/NifB/PqqE/SkfB family radical SAM enzyme